MKTQQPRQIAHIFVLMLENHSFDNMLAFSGIPGIKAATTNDWNFYNGKYYYVQKGAPASMPTDPGHQFTDVLEQLCGSGYGALPPDPSGYPHPINNSGFVSNYATTTTEGPVPPAGKVGDIMKCFDTPKQLPVIHQLATEFAICDHWFSSLPGPTWPNRFFLHGASSAGLYKSPTLEEVVEWETVHGFVYPNGSIYDAMNKARLKWRLYHDTHGPLLGAIPQASTLKGITILDFHSLDNFASDLQNPYDYQYTLIEPNYGEVYNITSSGGSSQHPIDGVAGGEKLIKTVYEAIRNSPLWNSSLLVIVYDEHGGFYDSVAPEVAPAPGDGPSAFSFKRYGVRVPAVIVSPFIERGVVDHTVYDHTSVLATLERTFGFPPLTNRDKYANDLSGLLTREVPRADCPKVLKDPAPSAKARMVKRSIRKPASDLKPIPQGGNLPGFLHIMLKTELELSGGTKAEKNALINKFKKIKTLGEARKYSETIFQKVKAAKESNTSRKTRTPPQQMKRAGK